MLRLVNVPIGVPDNRQEMRAMKHRRRALPVWLLVLGATTLLAAAQSDDGDTLPRRAWLGVALATHANGAAVTSVAAGSTADGAGIRPGDVITMAGEIAVRVPQDVIVAMARQDGGDAVALVFMRDGVETRRQVVLRSYPREEMPNVSFDYGSVHLDDASRLRTILSVPAGRKGPLPAVMLLQGGGCGSVDMPFAPDVGQHGLLRAVAAQGYVTMRVEKSGIGDSKGPPCDAIGYEQELAGYRAALRAVRQHPAVDPARIYLLGISLGGVFAPVLARDYPVRGIVMYGTIAFAPSPYPGRSERFFKEIAALDVPAAWAAIEARVLALHGSHDENTTAADHARIVAIVNAQRPGRAVHRELEGLDHCWTWHPSTAASKGNCGNGQTTTALRDEVLAFLREQ
jgi:dienelactone hydrolase